MNMNDINVDDYDLVVRPARIKICLFIVFLTYFFLYLMLPDKSDLWDIQSIFHFLITNPDSGSPILLCLCVLLYVFFVYHNKYTLLMNKDGMFYREYKKTEMIYFSNKSLLWVSWDDIETIHFYKDITLYISHHPSKWFEMNHNGIKTVATLTAADTSISEISEYVHRHISFAKK